MKQILTNSAEQQEGNKKRQWNWCIKVHSIPLPVSQVKQNHSIGF